MDKQIKYISKVIIKGLWGRYDLEWDLHPEVNILSGANGSGKSTVLEFLASMVALEKPAEYLFDKIKEVEIRFSNEDESLIFFKQHQSVNRYPASGTTFFYVNNMAGILVNTAFIKRDYFTDFIKPIDNELAPLEAVQKLSDNRVRTDLDWQLYQVQQKYLNYQIDIGKEALKLAGKNEKETQKELNRINAPKARFFEILNEVFSHTYKRVNGEANDVSFYVNDKPISAYELSSGEKQILIILLTVLVQNQKPSILFIDEPEISIHFDLQKKLIDYIRELNPNVQLIIATHSPAIIMDGWMDRVSEISDLIVHDNQAILENATE